MNAQKIFGIRAAVIIGTLFLLGFAFSAFSLWHDRQHRAQLEQLEAQ